MSSPAGPAPMPRPGWWARLSLRWRLMLIGLTGLAVSLAAAAAVLYAALATALPRTLADEANRAAQEVAALAGQGRVPDPLPVSGALVVQLLDDQGRVVGGSALADRLTPLATPGELDRVLAAERVTVPGSRSGLSGPLLLAATRTGPAAARLTVVAAVPTGDAETTLTQLRTTLLVGVPLLLALLGGIAWRVIGSALAPVEQLRRGAERIGAAAGGWGGRPPPAGAGGDPGPGSAPGERLPVPHAQDEIAALANTLNAMLARLEQLHARQRSLLDDAAHELRSPLATMLTQLEVAERLGEGGTLVGDLLPQVSRLTRLVEDLLVLARTDAGALPPRREPVDLRALLRDLVGEYAAARVPVCLDGTPLKKHIESVVVQASPDELRRAFANLVDNAVRHAATRVTVRVDATGAGVEVHVTDDGSGIPAGERERVFDRFTRLDEARSRDHGGSGLGLPIARELLRRNGAGVSLHDAHPGLDAVVSWPARSGAAGSPAAVVNP